MVSSRLSHVGVIGAGMAGLSCARWLHESGVPVTVFDKGRSPGGRAATRGGETPFDHGAQYFTVADDEFGTEVARWRRDGVVAEWPGRIVAIDRAGTLSPSSPKQRFVGVPGMNAMALELARSIDVRCGVTVAPPVRTGQGWQIADVEGKVFGTYDALVVTAPPVQTAALLADHVLVPLVMQAEMTPCMAVMAVWDEDLGLPFDGAFVNIQPLAWVSRNGSKPGRPAPQSWVLHASGAWSVAHAEAGAANAVRPLLEAFASAVDAELPLPRHAAGHLWRYALPSQPLDTRCLWDPTSAVAVAGDWCGGPRIEGAWLSGRAAAQRILDVL